MTQFAERDYSGQQWVSPTAHFQAPIHTPTRKKPAAATAKSVDDDGYRRSQERRAFKQDPIEVLYSMKKSASRKKPADATAKTVDFMKTEQFTAKNTGSVSRRLKDEYAKKIVCEEVLGDGVYPPNGLSGEFSHLIFKYKALSVDDIVTLSKEEWLGYFEYNIPPPIIAVYKYSIIGWRTHRQRMKTLILPTVLLS